MCAGVAHGARNRESPPAWATWAQGRRPFVGPSTIPSSGRYALFFYCHPQPESQQKQGKVPPITHPATPSLPLADLLEVLSTKYLQYTTVH
jgi:hypothetical protein